MTVNNDMLDTFSDIIGKTEQRLKLYMKTATSSPNTFPEWKDLINFHAVGGFICDYTQEAQKISNLIADARVWRIKLREFKPVAANSIRGLPQGIRATASQQMDRLNKLDDSIDDMITCLQGRYMNIVESINSLKLMAKSLVP